MCKCWCDPEPLPGDGPDYAADHQAWVERQTCPLPPAARAEETP